MLISIRISSQTLDYNEYHQIINNAEKAIFERGDIDSCLIYYEKAFDTFNEFIFPHDIINAVQLAFFYKKPNKKYLINGFSYGIKIEHLKGIPLFEKEYIKLKNDKKLEEKYSEKRKTYLSKINFKYLFLIYNLSIEDQLTKNKPKTEYDYIRLEQLNKIINYTKIYGFPCVKHLGVGDAEIFREIEQPEKDLKELTKKYKQKLSYFSVDENILASKFAIIILLHNSCTYVKLEEILLEAVKNGEIHPREVGLIYDNIYRKIFINQQKCDIPALSNGLFVLNQFVKYYNLGVSFDLLNYKRFINGFDLLKYENTNSNTNTISIEKVNDIRRKFNIASIELDLKKKTFEQKNGLKLFWGVWSCL